MSTKTCVIGKNLILHKALISGIQVVNGWISNSRSVLNFFIMAIMTNNGMIGFLCVINYYVFARKYCCFILKMNLDVFYIKRIVICHICN